MVSADNEAGRSVVSADNGGGGGVRFQRGKLADSPKPVEISGLRTQGASRSGQALESNPERKGR